MSYPLGVIYKNTEEAGLKIFEDVPSDSSRKGIKFAKADAQADFIPGFAKIKKGVIASALASVNISGTIGLRDNTLDMLLAVKPRSGGRFAVKLKGTAGRPEVSIDLAGSVFSVIEAFESAGVAVLKEINSGRKGQEIKSSPKK